MSGDVHVDDDADTVNFDCLVCRPEHAGATSEHAMHWFVVCDSCMNWLCTCTCTFPLSCDAYEYTLEQHRDAMRTRSL